MLLVLGTCPVELPVRLRRLHVSQMRRRRCFGGGPTWNPTSDRYFLFARAAHYSRIVNTTDR
jgi:hypothetical protein